MRKAQVFLREDQRAELRDIAVRTGTKQSDLIRRGVDMVIQQEKQNHRDSREALRGVYGIWKDRDDVDALFRDIRDDLEVRCKKLFVEET